MPMEYKTMRFFCSLDVRIIEQGQIYGRCSSGTMSGIYSEHGGKDGTRVGNNPTGLQYRR